MQGKLPIKLIEKLIYVFRFLIPAYGHRCSWMDWLFPCGIGFCVKHVWETGYLLHCLLPIEYNRKCLSNCQHDLPPCHTVGRGEYCLDYFCRARIIQKKPANMAIGKQEKCHLLLLDWLEIQGRVQGAITNLIN